MPSFDVVSEINLQEMDNAIQQTMKEVFNRFDFKGTKSQIAREKDGVHLISDNEEKIKSFLDIFHSKAVKRGISLKALDRGKVEPAGGQLVKCLVKLISGIETEKARELVKLIKGLNLKVQASIEGEKVRVSGKKKDDLQQVIQSLRSADFPIPLQFTNFRD